MPRVVEETYKLRIEGLVNKPLELSLAALRERFRPQSADAALTCAGNRRDEMSRINGVGPRKLEQFGAQFLALTRSREEIAELGS